MRTMIVDFIFFVSVGKPAGFIARLKLGGEKKLMLHNFCDGKPLFTTELCSSSLLRSLKNNV